MKTYKYKSPYGKEYTLAPMVRTYSNGRLAIQLIDAEDGAQFAVLTTNLVEEQLSGEDCAFVDTNNFGDAEEFIIKNHLGVFVYNYGYSGFCKYPEFFFNVKKMNKGD